MAKKAKKKAKASKNEKAAAKAGVSLKEYKSSKGSSSKSSSKSEKKATKQIKKYYGEKEEDVTKKAETEAKRLKEDMDRVLADAGIAKTRAMEDYQRNIGNIESNKAADVSDLNYYVTTSKTRTGEDLNTALAKETRRYSLEQDKINQDLADAGLTFSERTPEKVAAAGSAENIAAVETEANRSFQDIARYEAVKNRDIELKYGDQTTQAETTKTRTLEDILNEQNAAAQKIQRGEEDVAFGKAIDIRDISYARDTDIATTQQLFKQNEATKKNNELLYNVLG
jgi:hypothetical protein